MPVGPRETVEVTDDFFGPGVSEERIAEVIAFDTQVAEEDVALVRSVQLGLDSLAVEHGRLMAESEVLIAGFQARVREAIGNTISV